MNKGELTNAVMQRLRKRQLSKALVAEAVDAVFGEVRDTLTRGKSVTIVGFGSFSPAERKARNGRNPRTGEEISVPASVVVRFRPGAALRRMVGTGRASASEKRS